VSLLGGLPLLWLSFAQPRLQLLHQRSQRLHLLPQARILGSERGDLFLWRHASTLHPQRKSA